MSRVSSNFFEDILKNSANISPEIRKKNFFQNNRVSMLVNSI